MNYDFDVIEIMNKKCFQKHDSYRNNIITPAAIAKGELIGLTNGDKSPYHAIKRYGVVFMRKKIVISKDSKFDLDMYLTHRKESFETLFTNLTKANKTRYLPEDDPNRYLMTVGSENDNFDEWNNINAQIFNLVELLKLPRAGNKKISMKEDYEMHYSILKSEGGLKVAQQGHTDEMNPYQLGSNTKFFHLSMITAMDSESLIYVQPLGHVPKLVLLEQGDTILMRLDIPHAGAENFTDKINVRLHTFLRVLSWKVNWVTGFANQRYDWPLKPAINWNEHSFRFELESNDNVPGNKDK